MKNYYGISSGIIVVIYFLICFLFITGAQAFDLHTAYELALQNDPNLQKSISEYNAAQELKPQALSKLLPRIGANAEYIHTQQKIVSSDNVEFDAGTTDFPTEVYSISLNQPLFHYDSIVAYFQSKEQIAHAESLLKIAEQDMIILLADLYFQVLSAKDSFNAAAAEKKAVGVHYERAKIEHESGGSAITELYDAKARYSEVTATQIESQYLLDDAVIALQELTGQFDENVYILKETINFPNPDPDEDETWTQKALALNISLTSKRQAVQVARSEAKRLRSGHFPTLDLSGKYNFNATDGSLFGGGSEVETAEVAVSLNFPIYQGGFISSKTREAGHFLKAAERDYEKEYRAVSRFARSSYYGLKSAIERVNALKESVKAYELAVEAKLEGFRSNLYPLLAYLDAIRDLEVSKQEYARARYDYILNSLKLKQAAGILNAEDIRLLSFWFEAPEIIKADNL